MVIGLFEKVQRRLRSGLAAEQSRALQQASVRVRRIEERTKALAVVDERTRVLELAELERDQTLYDELDRWRAVREERREGADDVLR